MNCCWAVKDNQWLLVWSIRGNRSEAIREVMKDYRGKTWSDLVAMGYSVVKVEVREAAGEQRGGRD